MAKKQLIEVQRITRTIKILSATSHLDVSLMVEALRTLGATAIEVELTGEFKALKFIEGRWTQFDTLTMPEFTAELVKGTYDQFQLTPDFHVAPIAGQASVTVCGFITL